MTHFPTLYILQVVKSLLFHVPEEAWKRYPIRPEAPRIGHHREYPSPPPLRGQNRILRKQHLALPPLLSPGNNVWGKTSEIPYWWRVNTQTWVVLLIGWRKFLTNQKHYPGLAIDASSAQTSFCGETSGGVVKCRLISQADETAILEGKWDNR